MTPDALIALRVARILRRAGRALEVLSGAAREAAERLERPHLERRWGLCHGCGCWATLTAPGDCADCRWAYA